MHGLLHDILSMLKTMGTCSSTCNPLQHMLSIQTSVGVFEVRVHDVTTMCINIVGQKHTQIQEGLEMCLSTTSKKYTLLLRDETHTRTQTHKGQLQSDGRADGVPFSNYT